MSISWPTDRPPHLQTLTRRQYIDGLLHACAKARARISARQHAQAEANWRRQQPTPAAWIAAASLTILGVALLIHSRRRWLELELG